MRTVILSIVIYITISISPVINASFAEGRSDQKVIEHKVEVGDNLYLLAAYYLNNPRLWKDIYLANKDIILNPNQLTVGVTLKVALKDKEWQPKFSIEEWRSKGKEKQVRDSLTSP